MSPETPESRAIRDQTQALVDAFSRHHKLFEEQNDCLYAILLHLEWAANMQHGRDPCSMAHMQLHDTLPYEGP
jgi:hypothetical protein